MIVYSVTINIEEEIQEAWLAYMLSTHIPEVLATGMFTGHKFLRLISKFEEEKGITYNVQYYLSDMDNYYTYQQDYAPALKDDMSEKFGNRFMSFRTLLEEVTD